MLDPDNLPSRDYLAKFFYMLNKDDEIFKDPFLDEEVEVPKQ